MGLYQDSSPNLSLAYMLVARFGDSCWYKPIPHGKQLHRYMHIYAQDVSYRVHISSLFIRWNYHLIIRPRIIQGIGVRNLFIVLWRFSPRLCPIVNGKLLNRHRVPMAVGRGVSRHRVPMAVGRGVSRHRVPMAVGRGGSMNRVPITVGRCGSRIFKREGLGVQPFVKATMKVCTIYFRIRRHRTHLAFLL